MNVSAVIVTRGNVDLTLILESLPFDDIVVWDNSKREDLGVYGRYAGIGEAKHPVIYTQDDDVLVSCFDELLAAYEPGALTCNHPYNDIPWVSRGAIFDRELPERTFARYFEHFGFDRWFCDWGCDGVFSLLANTRWIDFGSVDLPHAFDDGRCHTTPGWYEEWRPMIRERVEKVLSMGFGR